MILEEEELVKYSKLRCFHDLWWCIIYSKSLLWVIHKLHLHQEWVSWSIKLSWNALLSKDVSQRGRGWLRWKRGKCVNLVFEWLGVIHKLHSHISPLFYLTAPLLLWLTFYFIGLISKVNFSQKPQLHECSLWMTCSYGLE